MIIRHALLFTAICFITFDASASKLNAYQALRKIDQDVFRLYIGAMADGMEWANTAIEVRGQPPLFCTPKSLALNSDNYIKLVDSEIDRTPTYTPDTDVALILLRALQRAFPCK